MKLLLITGWFAALWAGSFCSAAQTYEWEPYRPGYIVMSDSADPSVPAGYVLIEGLVKTKNNQPVAGAAITNGIENPAYLVASDGSFRGLFPVTDTAIYCFKRDFTNEVVFKYDFQSRHRVIVHFYLESLILTIESPAITFKPVLYAYNSPSKVSAQLTAVGTLTYTYPAIDEDHAWHFKTNDDGTLTDTRTGKNYPYLFWEGLGKDLAFKSAGNGMEGYFIKTDTCAQFLENVLAAYGLNEKESTDFITFWTPKMMQKKYALVQFLSNDDYTEKIASLDLAPQPESLLRLYMYFAPLDEEPEDLELTTPVIPAFSRVGFTVVEWGGSVISRKPAG
jgi:hypothetical protein